MFATLNTNNENYKDYEDYEDYKDYESYDTFFETEDGKKLEQLFINTKFYKFKIEDIINSYIKLYGNINPKLWSEVLSIRKRMVHIFIYMFYLEEIEVTEVITDSCLDIGMDFLKKRMDKRSGFIQKEMSSKEKDIIENKLFDELDMTEEKEIILNRLNILEKKHKLPEHSNDTMSYYVNDIKKHEDLKDANDLYQKLRLSLAVVYLAIMSEFKTELLLKNSANNDESVLYYLNEFTKLENICRSL